MKREPVEFQVNGLKLRGNLYIPNSSQRLANLFIHGWTGKTNEDAAEALARNGYLAMTFSMRGHNNSEGDRNALSVGEFLNDALAAYDFLSKKSQAEIGLVGNSFGGYLAVLASAQRNVSCLSLRVPANYREQDYSDQKANNSGSNNPQVLEWRKNKLDINQNRALYQLHKFKGPIQIIEAEKDEVVPHQTIQNYIDAIKDKSKLDYHLMKGWPHSLGDDPKRNEDYQSILLTWLEKVSERL